MRYALLILLMLAAACAETLSTTDSSDATAAAGAFSEAPQKIQTGVGVLAEALTACSAAKTKAKARYNCSNGWVETAQELRNNSGNCNYQGVAKEYLIFKTNDQPVANSVKFEVDWRNFRATGWSLRQYIQCSCDNQPCTVTSAFAPEEESAAAAPSDSGNDGAGAGAGVGETSILAGCTNASFCAAQKAFMNSASGVSWSWSGACSASATWFATASGGRTASAAPFSGITGRAFNQSQSWDANVYCTCPSTNAPNCHF